MAAKNSKIPQGNSKEEVYARRDYIINKLQHLIGTSIRCAALNNQKIHFDYYSIDETATHASKSYVSTKGALNITKAICSAKFVKTHSTHSKRQAKRGFIEMIELSAEIKNIGTLKIIVGRKKNMQVFHYCVTKKSS